MAEFRAAPLFVLSPQIGGLPAIDATSCDHCRPERPLCDVLGAV